METQLSDIEVMNIAIEEQGKCTTFPRVGAVIVKDGKILSKGYRLEMPGKHAERVAIEKLSPDQVSGAKLFTTLEPCVEFKVDQSEISCSELIIKSGITGVTIGVLDPNGVIYSNGFQALLNKGLSVDFFPSSLRENIESNTFKVGNINKGLGPSGRRTLAVLESEVKFDIQFPERDGQTVGVRWGTLQNEQVYLYSDNESVFIASGCSSFDEITDPTIFRNPSHYATMKEGKIAVINLEKSPFIVMIKLVKTNRNAIEFQWRVRKK